jgi:hypothetical protein
MLTVVDDNVPVALWSGAEINVALICAALPGLNPILARASFSNDSSDSTDFSEKPPLSRLRKVFTGDNREKNPKWNLFSSDDK